MQLNCTYSNYTEAAATCSDAQQHSTFTVQTLYKLYSVQLNVLTVITQKLLLHVQLHNSTTHLLYKLYTQQMNCTHNNYTEAAATCSAAQQHTICPADVFRSAVQPAVHFILFILVK